jgi:hypothetical protein
MYKPGDAVFIYKGSHQNETGTFVEYADEYSITCRIDNWPGIYDVPLSYCRKLEQDEEGREKDWYMAGLYEGV